MRNYGLGDRVVVLAPEEGGVRVYQAQVFSAYGSIIGMRVGIDNRECWASVDDEGYALGNEQNFKVVPMDEVLAKDLETHGEGFMIHTTLRDIEQRYESAEELAVQYQARMERWAIEQSQEHGEGYGFLQSPTRAAEAVRSPLLRADDGR